MADTIGDSGRTLEQLVDYLDRGRAPAIPAIDDDPECESLLASLERARGLSIELLERDASEAPRIEESWFASLAATIGREAKAGRDIPLPSLDPRVRLSITEGAIRELLRSAGDSVTGVMVARCRLELDPDAVSIHLAISVRHGVPVLPSAESVRRLAFVELLSHTRLAASTVDVTVVDIHELGDEG